MNNEQLISTIGTAESSATLGFIPLAADLTPPVVSLREMNADRSALLALAPRDAVIHPKFREIIEAAASNRPDVDLFYGDDVSISGLSGITQRLKPSYNASMLRSNDYIGAPIVVRSSAFHRLGGLNTSAGSAALYDLLLRAEFSGFVIEGIQDVLIASPQTLPRAGELDRIAALQSQLAAEGDAVAILPGLTKCSVRLRRNFFDHPMVTLVVPTRQARRSDGCQHILALLESLRTSRWPADSMNVLIGDDVDDGTDYGDLSRFRFKIRRVQTPRAAEAPFNYAQKMNQLWRAAESEHIVLMNDDIEVVEPDWLEALMTFAVQEDVGGVGARLLYGDGTLQHAGMIGGLFGAFAHPWARQSVDHLSYSDWAMLQRDYSAVTGAVFATRKSVMETVNGFDEQFALEYNDVDLCLRIGVAGYRIVQAPDAVLVHHEKASRGENTPAGSQTASFLQRWGQVIANDPAYHPKLSRDSLVVQPVPVWGEWYADLAYD